MKYFLAAFLTVNVLAGGAIVYSAYDLYKTNHSMTAAWISANACLTQAEANIKTNHMRKPKSEVEATHSLYCIQRARDIVLQ